MMPELGKYAFVILMSYALSLGLLSLLIAVTVARYRSAKAALNAVEATKHG